MSFVVRFTGLFLMLLLFPAVVFGAGSPPKTSINLVMVNKSDTALTAVSGVCNVNMAEGGGYSESFTFSGVIAPGASKSHTFTYFEKNSISFCKLTSRPKGEDHYTITGRTENAHKTTFTVHKGHVTTCINGSFVTIQGH